ncbi:MAG: outer membrane protein transport protein [Gammaproteobacteria bacterium]|nr:outer membrane protein transport protein [Gammaproteobacteria bacterium]
MKICRATRLAQAVAVALLTPAAVYATNGMNMAGYGPVSTSMGGASFAFDHGTAALMTNPATMGLMSEGSARMDIGLANLRPTVETKMPGASWDSAGDSYMMPGIGYARRKGDFVYGLGLMAQGGMGAEYGSSMMSSPGWMASGVMQGGKERSEVSMGRVVLPLVAVASDKLNVGVSLDYVWAGMDLQMAMPGSNMMQMMGAGAISGTLVQGLMGMMQAGQVTGVNYGYFDFSNDNDFTGEAQATGFAGKMGFTYKVSPRLTLGGAFNSQTNMSDLESSGAKVTMNVVGGDGKEMPMQLSGKIAIVDFQWPECYGIGFSYQASDKLMFAADAKHVGWSDVMENFTMQFTADNSAMNQAMGMNGADMSATMAQNWEDQLVLSIGTAYQMSDALALRFGINHADKPTQDSTLHYLFPAITETHVMAGFGYRMDKANSLDFSLSYVPEVEQTSAQGLTSTMSQSNWQIMYSRYY